MASIRDVALKAGVGIGTVSRALNGTGYISDETKKKIMDAVEELGYRPNELAQNLYRNRTGIVGAMMPDLEHPFFAAMTKSIETELYKHGYKCMVCDMDKKQARQDEFLELLQRNVMDGLISCVDLLSDRDIQSVHRPIVVLDRQWGRLVPSVHSDHRRGGQLAAQALMSAGCRRVLEFRPEFYGDVAFMERFTAFEAVMEERGIEVIAITTEKNHMSYEYDIQIAERYAHYLTQVDGIFAGDITAAACLRLASQAGIRVPERLKIIGYDGLPLTRLTNPILTTIRQDIPELARQLVDTIVKQIEGGKHIKQEQKIDVIFQRGGTI